MKNNRENELKQAISSEVEYARNKIIHAENHDQMLFYYWGISYYLDAIQYRFFDMDSKYKDFFEKMNTRVKQAYDYYYDNAKKDFENAHKRLF